MPVCKKENMCLISHVLFCKSSDNFILPDWQIVYNPAATPD